MHYRLLGSSVHGVLQTRILEWVAITYSRASSLTQGLNLGLLYCRQILYQLSYQGRERDIKASFFILNAEQKYYDFRI